MVKKINKNKPKILTETTNENNSSLFLTPPNYLKLEDAEKRVRREKNKNRKRVHVYWNEDRMVFLYNRLIKKEATKKETDEFWGVINILIDKIYTSYSSIRYYYVKNDNLSVEDAQSKIRTELYKSLFLKKNWSPQRGHLFTYVTVIVKNWYTFYAIVSFDKNSVSLEEFNNNKQHFLNKNDSYNNEENDKEEWFVNFFDYNHEEISSPFLEISHKIKTLFKKKKNPLIQEIGLMFFDFISDNEKIINRSFIRDVYNMIRTNNQSNVRNKEKERFKKFSCYFIPYIKKHLKESLKKEYNLKTNADYEKIVFKILRILKKQLRQYNIIRK